MQLFEQQGHVGRLTISHNKTDLPMPGATLITINCGSSHSSSGAKISITYLVTLLAHVAWSVYTNCLVANELMSLLWTSLATSTAWSMPSTCPS